MEERASAIQQYMQNRCIEGIWIAWRVTTFLHIQHEL